MTDCTSILNFLDEAMRLIEETDDGGEQGFIVCERGGELSIGARCSEPGNHCTIDGPPCGGGSSPALSFHVHPMKPPVLLLDALAGDPLRGERAKALLLPSAKDITADATLGTKYGCIGGRLNDGTALLWCYPAFYGIGVPDRVEAIQRRLKPLLAEPSAKLIEVLAEYHETIARPCFEIRLPTKDETAAKGTAEPPCPVCVR